MIPRDFILEWREQAPWPHDFQVEQDLLISRALVEIFSNPVLHDALSPRLGKPQWKQTEGRITFVYRISSEDSPPIPLRLRVETNTREHSSVYGLQNVPFSVSSRWFEGGCEIQTYALDELLGTKMRALYQRKQGRDLFDLAVALRIESVDPSRIVAAFLEYMRQSGHPITRAQFEQNFFTKLRDHEFNADIGPLVALRHGQWDIDGEAEAISSRLLALLPGAPWKRPTD